MLCVPLPCTQGGLAARVARHWCVQCLLTFLDPLRSCRLFLRSYLKTLHLTVLLCLFCAAAYKREHTGLLATCLVSEVHSVFQICGRMQVRCACGSYHTTCSLLAMVRTLMATTVLAGAAAC